METRIHTEHTAIPKSRAQVRKLETYTAHIDAVLKGKEYTDPESSLRIAGDTKYQNAAFKKVAHLMQVEHVVLVGIGGSSLGVEAVYRALEHTTTKKLHVIDAIEGEYFSAFEALCASVKKENIACIVVSKSGNTSETLINAARVIDIGTDHFGDAFLERVVFIGNEGTEFMKAGKKKKVVTIAMPECIGGRFSVFTAVGTVPLMLLGIDVAALCAGAVSGVKGESGVAAKKRACALAHAAEEGGVHTLNFFTFNAPLLKLGEWYRQLLAESIGKPKTKKKKPFSFQILPIVSSSIDLHSMAQLYLGGYAGIYTYFVHTGATEALTANTTWVRAHVPSVSGHAPHEVKDAIRNGVLAAYTEAKLPYTEIILDGHTPYEVGAYMANTLYEVMCLCAIFDIDAFVQPQVELYKNHTRALLDT